MFPHALVNITAIKSRWYFSEITTFPDLYEVSFPKVATRWQQRSTDGIRVPLMAWLKDSFAFYREKQWPAHFSFSPNNITTQHHHRFLPLSSATFQATSPFHRPTTLFSLSEQRSLPGVFCSFPENGNVSPIKKNSERWTKQPGKV